MSYVIILWSINKIGNSPTHTPVQGHISQHIGHVVHVVHVFPTYVVCICTLTHSSRKFVSPEHDFIALLIINICNRNWKGCNNNKCIHVCMYVYICCYRADERVERVSNPRMRLISLKCMLNARAVNGQCRSWQMSVDIGCFLFFCCYCCFVHATMGPIAVRYLSLILKTVFRLSALSLSWVNWCHQLEIIVPTHSNGFVYVFQVE